MGRRLQITTEQEEIAIGDKLIAAGVFIVSFLVLFRNSRTYERGWKRNKLIPSGPRWIIQAPHARMVSRNVLL